MQGDRPVEPVAAQWCDPKSLPGFKERIEKFTEEKGLQGL